MKSHRFLALCLVALLSIAGVSAILFFKTGTSADGARGDLVRVVDGKLVTDKNALADKTVVAVYYSARWCPPCRAFTPKLVAFYNEMKAKYPKFELVFVSHDRDSDAMKEYMTETKMPWVALQFADRMLPSFQQHAANGIPYLVVLDAEGNVLIGKGKDEDWRDPQTVLDPLKELLAKQP